VIVALAGGVGGAKLAEGLAQALPADELTVVVNTADDFTQLGLRISPDLDTVMYTLAGRANPTTGWGLAGETWSFMSAIERLGGPAWFRLGDQDLATHVQRTQALAAGMTLASVTAHLCRAFGVTHAVVPMTDDRVSTVVHTSEGALAFQDYFVRRRCEPVVRAIEYEGVSRAAPSPVLAGETVDAVVLCPSNPWLSIDPILALPGVRERLLRRHYPVIAVSPIIGGAAMKGPAAKIMRELGIEPSVGEIARHYADVIDGLVIDNVDAQSTPKLRELGCEALVTDVVMSDATTRARLAREVLAFAARLSRT
jgi:LPPG:FO 2-phospho-L-lactate transferase